MTFWRYQPGECFKRTFRSVFLTKQWGDTLCSKCTKHPSDTHTHTPNIHCLRTIARTHAFHVKLTCTNATVTTITIAYRDNQLRCRGVNSIMRCGPTTVMEIASSYCLVHKLINADASSNKIRGLRNYM